MIIGLKRWNEPDTYYTQVNNPTEEELRKQGADSFLISCGPTSAVSLLDAAGYDIKIRCPGSYQPQPEEVLTDFFNDPRNYQRLQTLRAEVNPTTTLGNTIPQWYEIGVREVFNVPCRFSWNVSFQKIMDLLLRNVGVLGCLKNPGHFIAIVACDTEEKTIIYNDPWPGDPWPPRLRGTPGFNRILEAGELLQNLQPFTAEVG